jgi:hypothetical protein
MRRFRPIPSLLALTAATVWHAGPTATAHAESARSVSRTVPLDPRGEVVIQTFKGSVDVTAWDRSEVRIDARIAADGDPALVPLTDVRIGGGAGRVVIESNYDKVAAYFRTRADGQETSLPFVRYTIKMPRAAALHIDDHKSETRVAGLAGEVNIDTHKGRVRVEGLAGAIHLATHKGSADVRFARRVAASSFDTYKGNITINVPAGAGADLVADLGRRGRLEPSPRVSWLRGGDNVYRARMNGGGPRIDLATYKGTIRVESR